jgi:hypothetical protein
MEGAMWYIIGTVVVVLIGLIVYAGKKDNSCGCCKSKLDDKPAFRTEDSLEKYDKTIDGHRSTVDFDDAE